MSSPTPTAPTILPADRAIIQSPAGRATLAKITGLLPLVKPQLGVLSTNAPSYVVDAVDRLLVALDQWTDDAQQA